MAARPGRGGRAHGQVRLGLVAAAGGLVTSLAFAPTGLVPLVLVGPAMGLWAAGRAGTAARGALQGLAFGLAFAFPTLRWMLEVDVLAGLVLPVIQGAFWAVPGAIAAVAAARLSPGWWVPAVAAAWTVGEAARARAPLTGFEWAQLAMATSDAPVRHAAAAVGALGLTGLIAGVAAALAALAPAEGRRSLRPLVVAAVALAAVAVVGAARWTAPDGALSVAVVQVDDPCPGDFAADCPGYTEQLVEAYVAGTEDSGAADLVLWGEDALPGAATLERAGSALAARADGLPAPVLAGVGTPTTPGRFLRWAALFDGDGSPIDAYAKRLPVPFGEYVPWRSVLGGISDVGRLVPSDLEAGDDTSPVVLATDAGVARLGTVVSWEVTFSRAVRAVAVDANALATLTTVASYGTSAASDQLLDAAQLRAVEHQKSMVVSATTGRSAFITPDGTIGGQTALFQADRLRRSVQLRTGRTPFARFGDLPAVLVSLGVLGGAFVALRRRARGDADADGHEVADGARAADRITR